MISTFTRLWNFSMLNFCFNSFRLITYSTEPNCQKVFIDMYILEGCRSMWKLLTFYMPEQFSPEPISPPLATSECPASSSLNMLKQFQHWARSMSFLIQMELMSFDWNLDNSSETCIYFWHVKSLLFMRPFPQLHTLDVNVTFKQNYFFMCSDACSPLI